MLVVKGQFLDMKVVMFAQQAIDIDTEGMCSQPRVKAST